MPTFVSGSEPRPRPRWTEPHDPRGRRHRGVEL